MLVLGVNSEAWPFPSCLWENHVHGETFKCEVRMTDAEEAPFRGPGMEKERERGSSIQLDC